MQTPAAVSPARSPAPRPVQLVIVRANGPLFYSVAAAALLEESVVASAQRMLQLFAGHGELCAWLRSEWLPCKLERAGQLRRYVEASWPEFDWLGACECHRSLVDAQRTGGPRAGSPAHEALARCMAAAQTAILYRTLARWADDSRLREMARVMAREEAASLPHFRAAFEQAAAVQRLAFLSTWRIALVCVRDARDEYLACAFHALQQQWGSAAPFPEIDYLEFVSRMRAVIERCSGLGMPERMLLRSWKKLPRARLAELGGAAFEICRQPARVAA